MAVTVNLGSSSCTHRERRQRWRKAQALDLMTMARVSRGDEMAEGYVAGTIFYVIVIAPSFRPAACPSKHSINPITVQFSPIHPSLQPTNDLSKYPVCVYSCLHTFTNVFLISNFRRVLNVVCFLLGNSPRLNFTCRRFGTICILHTHPPIKMEQTECSETLAYKIQTQGNYPEESIQLSKICPPFSSLDNTSLPITIDIPVSRLIYQSLNLSVSPYPVFHLPIILLIHHILPSSINLQLFILYMDRFISSDLDCYWRISTPANSPPYSPYSEVNPTLYHDLNTLRTGDADLRF